MYFIELQDDEARRFVDVVNRWTSNGEGYMSPLRIGIDPLDSGAKFQVGNSPWSPPFQGRIVNDTTEDPEVFKVRKSDDFCLNCNVRLSEHGPRC